MPPTDVVISWFATTNALKAELAKAQRPLKFIEMPIPEGQHYLTQVRGYGWPHPLRGILQHFGVDQPLRVAVLGFSEGCQGVRALLASQDAGYIEQAIFCDGIHCGWIGGKPNAKRDNICCTGNALPDQNCIGNILAYADLAQRGPVAVADMPPAQHYCTITHSSIVPPDFPSTTDTAFFILEHLFGSGWPIPNLPDGIMNAEHSPPAHITSNGHVQDYAKALARYSAGQNGLAVVGYDNQDPAGYTDHVYQANYVLPLIVSKLLVPRWNSVDPSAATCAGGEVSGPSCNPMSPARLPPGYMTAPEDASLNPRKYNDQTPQQGGATVWQGLLTTVATAAVATGIVELARWLIKRHL